MEDSKTPGSLPRRRRTLRKNIFGKDPSPLTQKSPPPPQRHEFHFESSFSFDVEEVPFLEEGNSVDQLLMDLSLITDTEHATSTTASSESEQLDTDEIIEMLNNTIENISLSPVEGIRTMSPDESIERFKVYVDEELAGVSPVFQGTEETPEEGSMAMVTPTESPALRFTFGRPARIPVGEQRFPTEEEDEDSFSTPVNKLANVTIRNRPAFEIYSSPDPGTRELAPNRRNFLPMVDIKSGKVFGVTASTTAMTVKQNLGPNTRAVANRMVLKILSITEKGHSKPTVTVYPRVAEEEIGDTRCKFSFQKTELENVDYENVDPDLLEQLRMDKTRRHMPIGVFTLEESLFPKQKLQRDSDLPVLNSVFLTPADNRITILAPGSLEEFDKVDHIIIELRDPLAGYGKNSLLMLAINKRVFAGLLFFNKSSVVINDIVVTENVFVGLKMNVELRRSESLKVKDIFVAITRAEFSIPYGFELVQRAAPVVPAVAPRFQSKLRRGVPLKLGKAGRVVAPQRPSPSKEEEKEEEIEKRIDNRIPMQQQQQRNRHIPPVVIRK